MKHRLQIIGTYLEGLRAPLSYYGIEIENVIAAVNPIAVVDTPDASQFHFCEKIDDVNACLDIKKNLKNMLSHNKEQFESNVLFQKI